MTLTPYNTSRALRDQSIESRARNVGIELERQLDMQFGIKAVGGGDHPNIILAHIAEIAKAAPLRRDPSLHNCTPPEVRWAQLLVFSFPFLSNARALHLIRQATSIDELISSINFEAGV